MCLLDIEDAVQWTRQTNASFAVFARLEELHSSNACSKGVRWPQAEIAGAVLTAKHVTSGVT